MGVPRTAILGLALAAFGSLHIGARVPAAGGTIVGVVSTKEPAPKPIAVTVDANVCGTSLRDEAIAVSASGRLANVVVTVPGSKAAAPTDVMIANQKCQFVPRVAVVRPGGGVKLSNKDPIVLHTAHGAMASGQVLFNVSLLPDITLSKSVGGPGLVQLTCNTHTWMRGYLVVTDELSAVTGEDGTFRLDGVPAGTYELKIWHERLKPAAPARVAVRDGETTTVDLAMVK